MIVNEMKRVEATIKAYDQYKYFKSKKMSLSGETIVMQMYSL